MTQKISLSLQQITLRVMALERVLRGRGLVTDEDMQAAYVAMVQEQAEAGKTESTEKNAD